MLFMCIGTYDADKRDEIVKRRLAKGRMTPKGMKVLGEWSTFGGGRLFVLTEGSDPQAAFQSTWAWSDLMKFEIIPVIETEPLMKSMQPQKRKQRR
jgi:hypothetical protein